MKKLKQSFQGRMIFCILLSGIGMLFIMLYSYQSFSSLIEQQIYGKIDAMYLQIQENIENDLSTIHDTVRLTGYTSAAQTYLLSKDPPTVIFSSSSATEFWSYAFQSGSICKNVYLYSHNQRYLAYRADYRDITRAQLKRYGFYDDITLKEPFFSDIFYISDDHMRALDSPESNHTPYAIYFSPVFSTGTGLYASGNRIVSAVICDMTSFTGWLKSEYKSSITSILMGGRLVSTTGADFDQELSGVLAAAGPDTEKTEYQGRVYLTKVLDIPKLDASLIFMVAEEEVAGPLTAMQNANLLVLFLITSITITLVVLLSNNLTRNINTIVFDTTHLHSTPGMSRVRSFALSELNAISVAINQMLERIEESAERDKENNTKLYRAVLAQNRAELIGYRSQINPHFLFNTLECMRSMAHVYGAPPIETMVTSMAAMFRYSLYSAMFVTFEKELEHVVSYVRVMKIRYPDRFHLKTAITPNALHYPVVSMILQPIVENAVQHAFPQKQRRCNIHISGFVNEKDLLIIRVTDNGIGLTAEEIEQLQTNISLPEQDVGKDQNSISLKNITRRIQLMSDEQFQIRFRSKKGSYTQVELQIPRSLRDNFQPLL